MKPRNDSKEFLSAINEDEELDDDSGSLLDITDKTDIYVEYEKNKNLYLSSGSILTSNRAMIQNQRIKLKERSKDISEAQYARLKNLKFLRYITMFVFFAVQMLTVPRWWLIDDNIKDKTWCDNDIYLNFDIPKISIYVSYPIEMACVIIVSATVLSKRMIRNLTINERLREAIVLLVSAAIIIEKSIILIVDGAPFIWDFLKPLLVYSVF